MEPALSDYVLEDWKGPDLPSLAAGDFSAAALQSPGLLWGPACLAPGSLACPSVSLALELPGLPP